MKIKELWNQRFKSLNDNDAFKARIVLSSSILIFCLLSVAVPARHSIVPLLPSALAQLLFSYLLIILGLFLSWKKPENKMSGYLLLFSLFLIIIPAVYSNGGLSAPAINILVILPLVAAFLVGEIASIIFLLISLVIAFAIYIFSIKGFLPEISIDFFSKHNTVRFIVLCAVLLLSFSLGFIIERRRARTLLEMTQLFQQRSELEKKIAEKDAITAMITTYSHEINNPLAIAIAHSDKLAVEESNERVKKIIDALARIEKVMKQIGNLTDQSQIETKEYISNNKMIKLK